MSTNAGPSADTARKNTIAKAVASLTRKKETDFAEGPAGLGDKFRKLAKIKQSNFDAKAQTDTYSTGVKQRVQRSTHRHG